jgi:hypothetical protein
MVVRLVGVTPPAAAPFYCWLWLGTNVKRQNLCSFSTQEEKAEKLNEHLTNVKKVLKRKLTLVCVPQEKSEMVRLSVSTNSPVRTKDEDLGKLCNKSMRMRSNRMVLAHISLHPKLLIGGKNQGR